MTLLLGKTEVSWPLLSTPATADYKTIVSDYRAAAEYAAHQARFEDCSQYLGWADKYDLEPPSSLRVTIDWSDD